MSNPTPIPSFLKGVPKDHWEKLSNAVMRSRWSQHQQHLKDLTESLPAAYRQGLVDELNQWKEDAHLLLDMDILSYHQIGMAKMLTKLDIPGQTAAIRYSKRYPIK